MKYGSLFSGIGGFDLGFERAGMECAWQCEIDTAAQSVLRKHFNKEIYSDVKTIGRDAGAVDLVCGGFPCQDLSVAGKRAGLAGERSGLWFEFARVIDELEPRWVVVENVPGLLSSNKGKDFAVILRWLAKRGYGVAWRVLDAQYFGVPQRRRRVFIVGSLGSGRCAEILFEREGVSWDTPPSREAGKDVAYSLRSNPSHSGDKGDGGVNTTMIAMHETGQGFWQDGDIAGTLRAEGENRPSRPSNVISFMPRKTQMDVYEDMSPTMHTGGGGMGMPAIFTPSSHGDYVEDIGTLRANGGDIGGGSEMLVAGTLSANYSKQGSNGMGNMDNGLVAYNIQHNDGGEHRRKDRPNGGLYVNETDTALTVGTTDLTAIAWQQNTRDEVRLIAGDGQIVGALSSQAGMKQQNYIGVRRLTPVECERLQGFPDNWTAGQADTTRYRQLGNAVAVPVAEWIGKRILEAS